MSDEASKELTPDVVVANWETYRKTLTTQSGEDRVTELVYMLDTLGERLSMCPASSRQAYHGCYVGGLVEHSLDVLRCAMKLRKTFPDVYGELPKESVVFATLLHDVGKVGTLTEDRYLPQTSSYYRDKGNLYEINQSTPTSSIQHQSLWLIQHFGIRCSWDEWQAVLLSDGSMTSERERYHMRETPLALLVGHADRVACQFGKSR